MSIWQKLESSQRKKASMQHPLWALHQLLLSWWLWSHCCSTLMIPAVQLWNMCHFVRPKPIIFQDKWPTMTILGTWPCSCLCLPLSSWLLLDKPAWDYSTCRGGTVLSLVNSSASTDKCPLKPGLLRQRGQGRLLKSTVISLKSCYVKVAVSLELRA